MEPATLPINMDEGRKRASWNWPSMQVKMTGPIIFIRLFSMSKIRIQERSWMSWWHVGSMGVMLFWQIIEKQCVSGCWWFAVIAIQKPIYVEKWGTLAESREIRSLGGRRVCLLACLLLISPSHHITQFGVPLFVFPRERIFKHPKAFPIWHPKAKSLSLLNWLPCILVGSLTSL